MVGGGQWGGRYQMRKGTRLPRFISPRNPFAREDAAATPSLPLHGGAGETVNTNTRTATDVPAEQRELKPPNLALLIAGRVVRGLWAARKKLKRTKRPAIPVFGKSAEQSELTLDTAKVATNPPIDANIEPVARCVSHPEPERLADLRNVRVLRANAK